MIAVGRAAPSLVEGAVAAAPAALAYTATFSIGLPCSSTTETSSVAAMQCVAAPRAASRAADRTTVVRMHSFAIKKEPACYVDDCNATVTDRTQAPRTASYY